MVRVLPSAVQSRVVVAKNSCRHCRVISSSTTSKALKISMLRNSPMRVKTTATSSSIELRCSCTRVITP
ncbi:hypothetical protein D9M73_272770 [compost metagenome]